MKLIIEILCILSVCSAATAQVLKRPRRDSGDVLHQIIQRLSDAEKQAEASERIIADLKKSLKAEVGNYAKLQGDFEERQAEDARQNAKLENMKEELSILKADTSSSQRKAELDLSKSLIESTRQNTELKKTQEEVLTLKDGVTALRNSKVEVTRQEKVESDQAAELLKLNTELRNMRKEIAELKAEKTRSHAKTDSEIINTQAALNNTNHEITILKNATLFLSLDRPRFTHWIRSRTTNNPERKCGSEYFYCKEDHRCISRKLVCDRKKDCSRGSDEDTCVHYETDVGIRDTFFMCNNGKAVEGLAFCDGDNDCEDNSGELKCDFRGKNGSCSAGQFSCATDGRCVDGSWRDDGVEDCDDGSDEETSYKPMSMNLTQVVNGCNETNSSEFTKGESMTNNRDYFLCGGSSSPPFKCIPNWLVCDGGLRDCPNGRDEEGCASTTYEARTYHCRNGLHIPKSQRCDGSSDCADGSDEINCGRLDSYEHSFQFPYLL